MIMTLRRAAGLLLIGLFMLLSAGTAAAWGYYPGYYHHYYPYTYYYGYYPYYYPPYYSGWYGYGYQPWGYYWNW